MRAERMNNRGLCLVIHDEFIDPQSVTYSDVFLTKQRIEGSDSAIHLISAHNLLISLI